MRRAWVGVGVLVLFLGGCGPVEVSTEAERALRTRVADTETYVGAAAAFVSDREVRFAAAGVSSRATNTLVDADTLFEIGSLTKIFTATLLVDMVRTGEVGYDDPINQYLPAEAHLPGDAGDNILIIHLVTHRSGLPRRPGNLGDGERPSGPYADYNADQLYAYLATAVLASDPGETFEYSNLGFGLLGHLLELRAGKSYADLLRERIFLPLGMTHTIVCGVQPGCADVAVPHDIIGSPTEPWRFDVLAGAGAIRSTPRDMAKFIQAVLTGEQPVADSARATMSTAISVPGGDAVAYPAWGRPRSESGLEIFWHDGGTGGSRSVLALNPARREGVFVVANSANGVSDLGLHALDATFPLRQFERLRETPLPADAALQEYAGRFDISGDRLDVAVEGNALVAQFEGDVAVRLLHYKPDGFFYPIADAQLVFQRADYGQIVGVEFFNEGEVTRGVRVEQ